MRTILLALILSISSFLNAQRFLPVIEDGRNIDIALHGPEGQIIDAEIYNNKLILAGAFVIANELNANRICSWDGSQFENFGDELTELTSGIYKIMDVCSSPSGVFIAGRLNPYNNILFGTGANWSNLGDGLDNIVYDLLWFEDQLIAAGKFENSGETPLAHVASWNGSSWSAMGQGMNDDVHDLIEYEGALYACGKFTEADNQVVNRIAKWNGTGWEAIGSGFDDDANCMIEFEGNLVIGGNFDNSGDGLISYPRIVSYDGNNFQTPYESPENASYFYMTILNNQLRLQSGNMSNVSAGSPYILNGNLIESNPVNGSPKIHKVIEYQNETLVLNSNVDTNAEGDEEFYENNSFLRYKPDGVLQSWIENEKLKGLISPSASLFQSRNGQIGLLSADFSGGLGSVYCATPWISTISPDNQLHGNFQRYHGYNSAYTKFSFGPKSDSYDQDYLDKYLQVWALSAEEVDNHIANYNQPGYSMPNAIATWPGNGRVEYGEQSHLAPFVDTNENGWYEPQQGDYPLIKGDQCVYYLICDQHDGTLVSIQPSGTEIGVMVYSFNTNNEDISHTVFVNYHIRNAAGFDFAEMKFGMWTDGDLGTFYDDFIGCSPEDNIFFFYNSDEYDEASNASFGFGDSIPAQGTLFLNHTMSNFMYYDNSVASTGEPNSIAHYTNLLNSAWGDGQHLLFGGNGFEPLTGADPEQPVDFMYFSDPNLAPGDGIWSEASINNAAGDRRGVGSIAPMTLGMNESVCIDIAFITAFPDQAGQNPALAVTKLKERSAAVKEFYELLEFPCSPLTFPLDVVEDERSGTIKLYPNPANTQFRIDADGQQIQSLSIHDMSGRIVIQKTNISESEHISIQNLDPGIYLINIELQGLPMQQSKLVKI